MENELIPITMGMIGLHAMFIEEIFEIILQGCCG